MEQTTSETTPAPELNPVQEISPKISLGTDRKSILFRSLLILFVVLIAIASGWYIKNNFGTDDSASTSQCNFANDGLASQKALEAKDISYCTCVKDELEKSRCQEGVLNAAYFVQARQQFKSDFCAMINNNLELKSSCESMVSSGIEYLKVQDPGYLASVYLQNNEYDKAIEILAVSEKVKTEASTMLSLALSYAGKGLAEHRESEFFPKAEELVNKAIALKPESAEAYRVQGYIYEVKPDLFKSIESYNKSLEKDPNYILSLVGRGHAYNLIGDLVQALADFQKAAELDKDKQHISIYANLCRLQTTRDDLLSEGIKNCQITLASPIAEAELKSDTNQILAGIYVREKNFEQALIYLENARVFSPQNVNLFVSLATLYNEKGEYAKAIEESKKALVIDSLKTAAYQTSAYAYLKTQDYAQAEIQALKGLEVVNKDPSLLIPNKPYLIQQLNYTLASIFAAKGDKEKEAQYKAAGDSAMEI